MAVKKEDNLVISRLNLKKEKGIGKIGQVKVSKSRKGQVSLFIILGIVLIIISIVLYVIFSGQKEEAQFEFSIGEVPQEVVPIQNYVTSCVDFLSREGLVSLGEHGGFIDPDKQGFSVNIKEPTGAGANSVQMFPEDGLRVAYWKFLFSENDCDQEEKYCIFSSNRPENGLYMDNKGDDSIESQLASYVEENIVQCLDGFRAFENQGFSIKALDEPKVTVMVRDRDVLSYLEYELSIERQGVVHNIKDFYAVEQVNLKKMYELAEEIFVAQQDKGFLERHALNMITSYSGLTDDKLPPKTELTFDPGSYKVWSYEDVKDKLKEILTVYVPGLQVFSAKNYERKMFDDKTSQALYDNMVLPLNIDNRYSDQSVDFIYLGWWDMYLDMNRGSRIVKPNSAFNPMLPSFGLQRYSTTYDLSFPVIVKIRDDEAFNGKGYNFMFALEANIRNNKPMKSTVDFNGVGEGYRIVEESLACNANQRNSGEVEVNVIDKSDGSKIEDAVVVYRCGEDSCTIGSTDEDGMIRSRFPICVNGILSAESFDHMIEKKVVSTGFGEDLSITLDAFKYEDKSVKVEAIDIIDSSSSLGIPKDIKEDENAIIRLEYIDESGLSESLSAVVSIDKGERYGVIERIVPGEYDVYIDVFSDNNFEVNDRVCFNDGLFGLGDEKCEDISIRFNRSYPSAGVRLDSKSSRVNLKESDIYSDKGIVFYVVRPNIPRTVDDLSDVGKFNEYSKMFRQELEPRFEQINMRTSGVEEGRSGEVS